MRKITPVIGHFRRYFLALGVIVLFCRPVVSNDYKHTACYPSPIKAADDPYDEYIRQAIQWLKVRNTQEAVKWFKKAKRAAKKNKRASLEKEAGELIERTQKDYTIYFLLLEKGQESVEQKAFREGQEKYKQALDKAQEMKADLITPVTALDQELVDEAKRLIRQTDIQRKEALNRAINLGHQYIQSGKGKDGLDRYQYAFEQMYFEEYEANGIYDLITRGRYAVQIEKGNKELVNQNYEAAITAYKAARDILPSNEVDLKIKMASERAYRQYMNQAEAFFAEGRHPESAGIYRKAQQYVNTYEVQFRMEEKHNQLVTMGRTDLYNQSFNSALIHFKNATYYQESPEVKQLLASTERKVNYQKAFAEARSLLEKEKIDGAYNAFLKASGFEDTREVYEQLERINNYRHHIQQGKEARQRSEPEKAVWHFRQADETIHTKEVDEMITEMEGG